MQFWDIWDSLGFTSAPPHVFKAGLGNLLPVAHPNQPMRSVRCVPPLPWSRKRSFGAVATGRPSEGGPEMGGNCTVKRPSGFQSSFDFRDERL